MNRKIKFSLNFNNHSVRTIEEFKDHFDLKEAVECSKDSRLIRWLDVHGYIDYYNKVKEIKSDIDTYIAKDLIKIFSLNIDELAVEKAFKIQDIDNDEITEQTKLINTLKLIESKIESKAVHKDIKNQIIKFNSSYEPNINSLFHSNINNLCTVHYTQLHLIKEKINNICIIHKNNPITNYNLLLLETFKYICEKSTIAAYEFLKNEEINEILINNYNSEISQVTNKLLNKTLIMCEENYNFKNFIYNEYFSFYEGYLYSKVLIIYANSYLETLKNKVVSINGKYVKSVRINYVIHVIKSSMKIQIDKEDKPQVLKDIINNKVSGIIYSKI